MERLQSIDDLNLDGTEFRIEHYVPDSGPITDEEYQQRKLFSNESPSIENVDTNTDTDSDHYLS